MQVRAFILFFIFLFPSFSANAQDCTLDIGGKNAEIIEQIFQLNASQKTTMETLRGELEIKTKGIEEEIQKLFDQQPQSTEEELITLAEKYKVLEQKLVNASWESDKKLLATFNTRQYERYTALCQEAFRKPIKVVPVIVRDSIAPK